MRRQQRRFEQRNGGPRTPGFTPMRNARIAMRHAFLVVGHIETGVSAPEAERLAWQEIARSLPHPRKVRNYSAKPSKSDDPSYRKTAINRI